MDIETAELIEHVNARIDALEISLRVEIRGSVADAKEFARGLHEESGHAGGLPEESKHYVRSLYEESRQFALSLHTEAKEHALGLHEEARRHAHVLNESVRDDIRMLAEALATVLTRLDAGR